GSTWSRSAFQPAPPRSSSLHCAHDLDLLALTQLGPRPGAARHNLAVDGHRHAAALALDTGLVNGCLDRRSAGQLLPLAVEENSRHRPTPACSGASRAATCSAVSGASRTPLRK